MISAVVLTKNEEKNIVDCLESINWCNETIIIDDYSTDRTLEVAKSFNPKIKSFQRNLEGNFSAQRNFGISKAIGEWILFIDADERLSESLKGEILDFLKSKDNEYNGFYVKRRDFMWGKELKHGEVGNIRLVRLGRRDSGKWQGKVHETWNIKGKVGKFKMLLFHYPHQDISTFLKEVNRYTDFRAQELFEQGVKVVFWQIILYPKAKFLLNYFLRLGFLDGIEGLVFAVMMSFHSFLVRGKLWLLINKKND
ncbi:glycosyltransferase family 2 protein [Patescibacteria group bacterium]|nr:glycosyltransferase family 2 protein [Patescibacteria group bacterium]